MNYDIEKKTNYFVQFDDDKEKYQHILNFLDSKDY